MEPICGEDLHKVRMDEMGKCSRDLMICYNFNPRAKDKRRRDIYRCERHALHIMSFDHMKHIKFAYINPSKKPKITKTEKLINNFLKELKSKGETNMKCYWKVENGFITGTLCFEAGTAEEHEILDGLKNRFGEQVHPIADTPKTVDEKPRVKRGRPRMDQVEDKPRKKRGRPKGSKNKPKPEAGKPKRKRGRPRKDGR